MFTDVVGFSALSQQNEALALELLDEHFHLLRPLIPREKVFEWLGKAYEERDGWMRIVTEFPLFDEIRQEPEYIDLLKKVGLSD